MDSLAERIRKARVAANMTQDYFAKALGTHKNTVGRWERGQGEPEVKSITLMCSVLGVSPYWLLAGQGPMLEKDRDIKMVAGPGTKAGDLRGFKPGEVSGGPEFDATMARLQARMMQLERERDEAREGELRAKDEALKAKDQALEAMQALVKGKAKDGPSIDDEPETPMIQYSVPQSGRKNVTKK